MSPGSATPISAPAPPRDGAVRLGGWLFKRRSWLPMPIVLLLVALPRASPPVTLVGLGLAIVASGEALRLWAVHHIGVISRTRSERLGPLVSTGPFAHVRNPLYLGNMALWIGFTVAAGLAWFAPVVGVLLALEYHAIVRWEEEILLARLGSPYRDYMAAVPRWAPRAHRRPATPAVASSGPSTPGGYSWRETLTSERSTLLAIALGWALVMAR